MNQISPSKKINEKKRFNADTVNPILFERRLCLPEHKEVILKCRQAHYHIYGELLLLH